MGKNINTSIWTVDNDGYVQTTQNLFTSTPPVYTHADHIDTSFNFCVNGVPSQSKRAVLHLTDRTNNVYTVENIDNIFIPNNLYDEKGNNYSYIIHKFIGTNGGVSNFSISADSQNQPSGGTYKTRVNFDYLSSVWSPRLNIRTYDTTTHSVGADNFKTLNDMDAVCTNQDALANETWWEYCARNESKYILTMDRYNDGVYITNGAFQSTSVFEGQTRVGIAAPRISWLSTPHSYGNSYGTSDCIIYYGNGRDHYADMTFDVLMSLSLTDMVKKDEWDDTQYNKPRHNVLYGIKIDKELILSIISSYGLPFSFKQQTNISIGNIDYALPEIKNNTTTGNYFRGAEAITADTDNNRWANTKDIDNKPAGGGGGGDDDDPSDDQAWGSAYSGAGAFSKFYLCTATDLANLRTWFGGGGGGDQIPDGFDPMGQVLGLLQYPVSISGTALAPEEIVFRSGKTIVHTGVNADRSTGGFLHIDCGSVDIPRRMQERGVPFLDFETSLEIYVPFCGTAPLDVQTCVGKTLTCDMYVATATGDVSAVIAAGGHPVAYMSGNMAESLPISSSGYGMYLAACKSTWGNGVSQVMNQLTGGTTSTIKNVNQAALNETLSYGQTGGWGQSELLAESYNNPTIGKGMAGAASAKGVAAIGLTTTALNIANAASTGYEQYQRVKNASYTSVSGSFTSCAAWNYPFTPYVKITRPHKQIPQGGRGDYKHTSGIPLVETRTLSGAPGLTTCVNPDVSGIANATAQEKDIIYRALVNGVIV